MRRSDEWVVLDAAAADVGASGSAGWLVCEEEVTEERPTEIL